MAYHGLSDGVDLDRCDITAEGQGEAQRVMVPDTNKQIKGMGNIALDNDKAFIIGDPAVDGSWKFEISGDDLTAFRRESSAWVVKGAFMH